MFTICAWCLRHQTRQLSEFRNICMEIFQFMWMTNKMFSTKTSESVLGSNKRCKKISLIRETLSFPSTWIFTSTWKCPLLTRMVLIATGNRLVLTWKITYYRKVLVPTWNFYVATRNLVTFSFVRNFFVRTLKFHVSSRMFWWNQRFMFNDGCTFALDSTFLAYCVCVCLCVRCGVVGGGGCLLVGGGIFWLNHIHRCVNWFGSIVFERWK